MAGTEPDTVSSTILFGSTWNPAAVISSIWFLVDWSAVLTRQYANVRDNEGSMYRKGGSILRVYRK